MSKKVPTPEQAAYKAIHRRIEAETAAKIVADLRARETYWREVAEKQSRNPNISDPVDTARRCRAMADGFAEAIGIVESGDWKPSTSGGGK